MGMGIAALMTGAGAGAGLQQILKQRLLEREMALREQSQAQDVDYRNRALAQGDETNRFNREAIQAQRDFENQLRLATTSQKMDEDERRDLTEQLAPGDFPQMPQVAGLKRLAPGLLRAQSAYDQNNEEIPVYQYGGTATQRRQEDAARQAASERAADRELRSSEGAAQRENTASIAESNRINARAIADMRTSQVAQKPPTGTARAAVKYLERMRDALKNLEDVDDEMAQMGLAGQMQSEWAPNMFKSGSQQRYNQALSAFTEARLRKDSGAAVPPSEYAKDREVYGVQPGDKPEVIAQKRKSRYDTAKALSVEAGPSAMQEHYGDDWQSIVDALVVPGKTKPKGGITILSIEQVK